MPRPTQATPQRTYEFPSGVRLSIRSQQREVLGHFDAEYGSLGGLETGEVHIEVYAGRAAISSSPALDIGLPAYRGRHKTVRWRVAIGDLTRNTTRVEFQGSGQLVVSFLQTFYLEPLLRLKFAARDHALVHAASLCKNEGSVLFPAGSRVGKSSLTLRHAAAGQRVQGDNYVILTPAGRTLAFPRRLRIYSDLPAASPDVFRLLSGRERWRLRLAGLVRRFSLGYANLPRRLTMRQIVGIDRICREARLDSLYFLAPADGGDLTGPSPVPTDEAIARMQTINRAEGARLREALAGTDDAGAVFERTDRLEADILERALSGVPAFELLVPRVRNPSAIISEISRVSGLGWA